MTFDYDYGFSAKGGQKTKDKADGTSTLQNKSPEQSLKIKIKGHDGESVSDVLAKLAEDSDIDECTITFTGSEASLKEQLKDAIKIIAAAGGQKALDEFFGKKEKIEA